MEEEKKEIIEEQVTAPTPEEKPEKPEVVESEKTTEDIEDETIEDKDIDHKKELEKLEETQPPQRTEVEKAKFTFKKVAERLVELGEDPTDIVKPKEVKKVETEETDIDSRFAQTEARLEAKMEAKRLAKTEDEAKHIMWYVENKGLSVADAHVLANKGRVMSAIDELKRSNVRVEQGSNSSGRKTVIEKTPELAQAQQQDLLRQGFIKQKDGSWEGKKMRVVYNPATKGWDSVKK